MRWRAELEFLCDTGEWIMEKGMPIMCMSILALVSSPVWLPVWIVRRLFFVQGGDS